MSLDGLVIPIIIDIIIIIFVEKMPTVPASQGWVARLV